MNETLIMPCIKISMGDSVLMPFVYIIVGMMFMWFWQNWFIRRK